MKLRTQRRKPEERIDDLLPTFLEDGHRANPGPAWEASTEVTLQRQETRVLEDRDTEETAQLLGITPNVVKIRLHRARQALRTLLDPYFRRNIA